MIDTRGAVVGPDLVPRLVNLGARQDPFEQAFIWVGRFRRFSIVIIYSNFVVGRVRFPGRSRRTFMPPPAA
jgi:hypothetical protein